MPITGPTWIPIVAEIVAATPPPTPVEVLLLVTKFFVDLDHRLQHRVVGC